MIKSKIEVYVNNNPVCDATIESVMKNEVWNIKNRPYISVKGIDLENGMQEVNIQNENETLYEGTTEVVDNQLELKIDLESPMASLKMLAVTVGSQKYEVPIKLNKIYGTVKYFDGSVIENPVINITGKDIAAIGDENGNFEIYTYGNKCQMGVFQKDYSKETLEAWIYNIELNEDVELNICIDKMEVYRIHMWNGEVSDYIHFTPMSLNRIQNAMKEGIKSELDMLEKKGVWPSLDKKDVTVYTNEEEVKVLSFQEVPDFLTEHNNKVYSRNSYVLSIPKGHTGKVIKIQIKDQLEIENNQITEKGEGYYFWK